MIYTVSHRNRKWQTDETEAPIHRKTESRQTHIQFLMMMKPAENNINLILCFFLFLYFVFKEQNKKRNKETQLKYNSKKKKRRKKSFFFLFIYRCCRKLTSATMS